ncbi:MAG TPA: aromatic hydrocarbon degradation protein [Segetibacter sp.]
MKKFLLSTIAILSLCAAKAQLPEDALRYSYFPQHGTARNLAIGGAMGSLGGDINALYVNPAGLGMYKTREFVLSPGFSFNRNKADFRGTNTNTKNSGFNLGTSGLVIGFNNANSKWTNQAFSIGISKSADFNNIVSYKGKNDISSLSEQFAEQFSQSGLNPNQALNEPAFAYGTAPAIYTYLIDTFRNASGGSIVKALPEFLLEQGIALDQERTIETKGGIYEVAIGYAANMDDKLYIGGSLGIPIVNYERFTRYRESDPSGNGNNNFSSFELNDYLTTKGFGVNAKLGLIFKPADQFRFGLTVHTPTYYSLTDRQTTDLTANTEDYEGVHKVNSSTFTGGEQGKTLYTASTPWKLIASGSYVFREVNDTRRQRAFITADIEYVGYGGSGFKADGETVTSEDQQYYEGLKAVIKEEYKGAFNYRVGGELKLHTVMFRLGGSYYSNPYRNSSLSSNMMLASGGIGYRNHGMFIDLTYVHNLTKDVNFPYRLSDKQNTFAMQRNTKGNIMMTLGFKF